MMKNVKLIVPVIGPEEEEGNLLEPIFGNRRDRRSVDVYSSNFPAS